MVTNLETIRKIRAIIDKHYKRLSISVLGKKAFSSNELQQFKDLGIDIDSMDSDSFLEMVYHHNFINQAGNANNPTSVGDMKNQQRVPGIRPSGEAHDYTVDSLNESTKQHIDKMKMDVTSRIEGIISQNNTKYKHDALQNLNRTFEADELVKESSLGRVKQLLRDTAEDGSRDWQRVALTEMSNAIGAGSVDRIVTNNKEKDLEDVYVFRVIVGDAKTCKYCRRFYQDTDGSPKLYKLSTLLGNGTNYGKKTDSWLPVVGATHPNTRTSQIIELPPGWKIMPGGRMTFIGMDKWNDYILEKVNS